MSRLLEDLLAVSRAARPRWSAVHVDLTALAWAAVERLREGDPEREVEVHVAPGIEARGDPGLLAIALGHLLENAWKFTAGNAVAHIEVGMEEAAGERVYFVKDDGIGFDMAYRDQLFRTLRELTPPR